MRLTFFQRLLDQLHGRVALINHTGSLLLVSTLAERQFALVPGMQVEVLHREGDHVLIRQPVTQQLHSALAIRWLKFEFLLFQHQPDAVVDMQATRVPEPQRGLVEFCSSPAVQASLEPQQLKQLQQLLQLEAQPDAPKVLLAADLRGGAVDPLMLIERAFGPALEGVDEFFLQAPSALGTLYGETELLASALRSLVVELVSQHRSSRLLVRLHQSESELLITVQDIGDLQLPRMTRLSTDDVWSEPVMRSPDACAVIERHGGHLRMRGDMAQGRVTFSLPIAVKNVFN
ncbi:hypothetical protein A8C75_06435 [Marinobacterium aestuarii]|uniref:Uncharacterized protein n=1 Tax=Marinobacterium aestuarii TaxID=1821621 RepID=A0A1A9EWA8_9GAMM|nr:sensor histidine kinase [Marinobacterium aestuarii]ANG62165.1 hypothetical protein A8C75_06435 [Marinobacterium aestuarii]